MFNMYKKVEFFSAFLEELLKYEKIEDNKLSSLRILLLLFLGISENEEYLEIFNNFVVRDLGIFEKDIFDSIMRDLLKNYMVLNYKLVKKKEQIKFSNEAKKFASETVEFLNEQNENLIKMKASELVDIVQKWNCWTIPRSFNKKTISTSLILAEKGHGHFI